MQFTFSVEEGFAGFRHLGDNQFGRCIELATPVTNTGTVKLQIWSEKPFSSVGEFFQTPKCEKTLDRTGVHQF
jgi:hypothetical protein